MKIFLQRTAAVKLNVTAGVSFGNPFTLPLSISNSEQASTAGPSMAAAIAAWPNAAAVATPCDNGIKLFKRNDVGNWDVVPFSVTSAQVTAGVSVKAVLPTTYQGELAANYAPIFGINVDGSYQPIKNDPAQLKPFLYSSTAPSCIGGTRPEISNDYYPLVSTFLPGPQSVISLSNCEAIEIGCAYNGVTWNSLQNQLANLSGIVNFYLTGAACLDLILNVPDVPSTANSSALTDIYLYVPHNWAAIQIADNFATGGEIASSGILLPQDQMVGGLSAQGYVMMPLSRLSQDDLTGTLTDVTTGGKVYFNNVGLGAELSSSFIATAGQTQPIKANLINPATLSIPVSDFS